MKKTIIITVIALISIVLLANSIVYVPAGSYPNYNYVETEQNVEVVTSDVTVILSDRPVIISSSYSLELKNIASDKKLQKEKQKISHFMKQKMRKIARNITYNDLIKKNKKYVREYERVFKREIIIDYYNVIDVKILSIKKIN